VKVFLYVSLVSSTDQLHDSLGSGHACSCSEAGFSCQQGDSAWEYTTEEQRFSVVKRMFIKKYVMFKVESVCFVKRSTAGSRDVAKISVVKKKLQRKCGSVRDNSQSLLCTGKAMGLLYQYWSRICREISVLSRLEYHFFTFYIHLWPIYWLPPKIWEPVLRYYQYLSSMASNDRTIDDC
jgi:hypothetical protein